MTQFMLVRSTDVSSPEGVSLRRVGTDEDLFAEVAERYLGDASGCQSVLDSEGRLEPLVDAVWAQRQRGAAWEGTPFASLAARLVRDRDSHYHRPQHPNAVFFGCERQTVLKGLVGLLGGLEKELAACAAPRDERVGPLGDEAG